MLKTGAHHVQRPASIQPLTARAPLTRDGPDGDWHTAYPPNSDPLGNDLFGNCDECALFQWVGAILARGSGDSLWRPTTAMTTARYSKLTGFDLTTGKPDNGTNTDADLIDFCTHGIRPEGLEQREIVPFPTSVDPANLEEMRAALRLTPLLVTFNLMAGWQSIEDDATAWKRPWTTLDGEEHRVLIVGRDAATGCWVVRTWGGDVLADDSCRTAILAVDALVSRDMAEADFEALRGDLAGLVG